MEIAIVSLVFLAILSLIGWLCWGISKRVYRARTRAGSPNARLAQILTFAGCFLAITGGIYLFLRYGVTLGR